MTPDAMHMLTRIADEAAIRNSRFGEVSEGRETLRTAGQETGATALGEMLRIRAKCWGRSDWLTEFNDRMRGGVSLGETGLWKNRGCERRNTDGGLDAKRQKK